MLLAPKGGGPLVARKNPTLAGVADSDVRFNLQAPPGGLIQSYGSLRGGFGLNQQERREDGRYRYTLGADVSGDAWIQGPEITSITPTPTVDSTNGISHFFEVGSGLYALNGRYALYRSGDLAGAWVSSRDFGSGNIATDVIVFFTNASGGANYAYAALGDGSADYIQRFDGTTWTAHASLQALAFARTGRELYRGVNTNDLAKVDTDAEPWTAGNWASVNSFTIGEKNRAIVRLATTIEGTLLVFKTDGIYSLRPNGEDLELFPFLRLLPNADNGKAFAQWRNNLYVPYGYRLFEITPELTIRQVGPELLTTNDSDVRGYITAIVGTEYALYALMYNVDDDNSYLMKWDGTWIEREGKEIPAWHGSLSQVFSGIKGTAMHVSTVGAPANHRRVYMGFDSGQVSWFVLPCVPNPVACDQYRYSTTDGEVHSPRATFLILNDLKGMDAVTVTSNALPAGTNAEYNYRSDPTAGFTALGTFTTSQRDRKVFTSGVRATVLDQRLDLHTGSTTSTPQVTAMAVEYTPQPPLKPVYEMQILAEDGLIMRDGTPLAIGAETIKDNLRTLYDNGQSVEFILPDDPDKTHYLKITDLAVVTAWDDRRERPRQVVAIQAIEQQEQQRYGTYARWAAMTPTYDDWDNFTYAQWENL